MQLQACWLSLVARGANLQDRRDISWTMRWGIFGQWRILPRGDKRNRARPARSGCGETSVL